MENPGRVIHRSMGSVITEDLFDIKRNNINEDVYKNMGFRTPYTKPYMPIGKMSDVKMIYDEIKKRFHLPIKDPKKKGEEDKDEPGLPEDFLDTFYTQRIIDPEQSIQTRLWHGLEAHTQEKIAHFNFLLKKKKHTKSLSELLKKQGEDDDEDMPNTQQDESNPYGFKIQKGQEYAKKSSKSLQHHVKCSNLRVLQVKGGQSLKKIATEPSPTNETPKVSPNKKNRHFFQQPNTDRSHMKNQQRSPERPSDVYYQKGILSDRKSDSTSKNVSFSPRAIPKLHLPKKSAHFDSPRQSDLQPPPELHLQAEPSRSSISNQENKAKLKIPIRQRKTALFKFSNSTLRNSYESRAELTTEADTEGDAVFMTEPSMHSPPPKGFDYRNTISTIENTLSGNDKIAYINVPELFQAMRITERERIKKPVVNPHIKQQKAPLKYRMVQKIEDIEVKKRIRAKLNTMKNFGPTNKSKTRDFVKQIKNVVSDEKGPLLKNIISKKRISFMKTVRFIMQKNQIVRNFQEEIDKRKEKAIRKLQGSFNSYFDRKNEKNKELDYKVVSVEMNRGALSETKLKNLGKALQRSRSEVGDFLKINKISEQDVIHDNVPGDLKWYTELVEELSITNYCINRGVFLLFDQIRYFLERGIGIDWKVLVEILGNIDKRYFENRTLVYLLKRITKSIGKHTQDLKDYFEEKQYYQVVRLLEKGQ